MENLSKKSSGPTIDQRVTGGTLPTLTKHGRIVIDRKKHQVVNDLIANADSSSTYKMKHTKPKKSEKLGSHISIEQSIDPDRLVERTLHSYLCSCGNRPTECPDPVTLLDPEETAARQMVFECERREADIVKKGILPLLRHEDLISLRKREMLHKRWTARVYHPLHREVMHQLRSPQYDDMVMTRHMMYMAYLEHRNRKKDVFLDEVVDPPRGYRYVQQDRLWLHARTRPLANPMSVNRRRRKEEARLLQTIDDAHDFTRHLQSTASVSRPWHLGETTEEATD